MTFVKVKKTGNIHEVAEFGTMKNKAKTSLVQIRGIQGVEWLNLKDVEILLRDTAESLKDKPVRKAKFEKRAKALANAVSGSFDYAYGDTPCIDQEYIDVPSLTAKLQKMVDGFRIEGMGYTIVIISDSLDEVDDGRDYLQVTATINNIAVIKAAALERDICRALTFAQIFRDYVTGY